jgi:hypothetical protein
MSWPGLRLFLIQKKDESDLPGRISGRNPKNSPIYPDIRHVQQAAGIFQIFKDEHTKSTVVITTEQYTTKKR